MKDIRNGGEEFDKVVKVDLNTISEKEVLEFSKYKNPFINRALANNKNITSEIRCNPYIILEPEYKESMFREDLEYIYIYI